MATSKKTSTAVPHGGLPAFNKPDFANSDGVYTTKLAPATREADGHRGALAQGFGTAFRKDALENRRGNRRRRCSPRVSTRANSTAAADPEVECRTSSAALRWLVPLRLQRRRLQRHLCNRRRSNRHACRSGRNLRLRG